MALPLALLLALLHAPVCKLNQFESEKAAAKNSFVLDWVQLHTLPRLGAVECERKNRYSPFPALMWPL